MTGGSDIIVQGRDDGHFRITYRWMSDTGDRRAAYYAAGGVAACVLFALIGGTVSPSMFAGGVPPAAIPISLGLLAPFLWAAAMARFETVDIRIDSGLLSAKHGPLPWPGGCTVSVDDIAQIEVKHGQTGGNYGRGRRYGVLYAVLSSGKRRRLVGGLFLAPEQGHKIKQALAEMLGLE